MLCRPDGKPPAAMPPPARIHPENPASSGLSSRPRLGTSLRSYVVRSERWDVTQSHPSLCPLPTQSPSSTHGYRATAPPHSLAWHRDRRGQGTKLRSSLWYNREYLHHCASCIRSPPSLRSVAEPQQHPRPLSDGSSTKCDMTCIFFIVII